MIYYANGCSYTWGGALFDFKIDSETWLPNCPDDHPVNARRLQTVYPHHLGKMIGAKKVINESLGGGSNFRIVRKTLEYFNNLIIQNRPLTDHFVTIQWTEPSRTEFYYNDEKSWGALMNTGISLESTHYKPKYLQDLYKNHYRHHNSSIQDFHFFINHVYTLGNFFKVHKIPYMFFKHSGWDSYFYEDNLMLWKDFYKLMYQFNWLYNDFAYHMQKSPIEKVTDSHPNEKGHKQWAIILYDEIVKTKLINITKDNL